MMSDGSGCSPSSWWNGLHPGWKIAIGVGVIALLVAATILTAGGAAAGFGAIGAALTGTTATTVSTTTAVLAGMTAGAIVGGITGGLANGIMTGTINMAATDSYTISSFMNGFGGGFADGFVFGSLTGALSGGVGGFNLPIKYGLNMAIYGGMYATQSFLTGSEITFGGFVMSIIGGIAACNPVEVAGLQLAFHSYIAVQAGFLVDMIGRARKEEKRKKSIVSVLSYS